MCLYLLIFCGILFQGVIPIFADADFQESSDFLVRQKRVISYEQGGAYAVHIQERPYIVHIKKSNQIHCVGSILSNHVVISAAECTESSAASYTVFSKAAHTYRGTVHNVTNIKVHNGNLQGRPSDGIALLIVDPSFVYSLYVEKIDLHSGLIIPGMLGTVSGWGYNVGNRVIGPGTIYPTNLRSIQVPIISHRDCVNRYRNYYPITDKDICTFHPLRSCGHTDGGAPLVIDNTLVGIFLRSGPLGLRYNIEYPEVFALLQHSDYSNWIRNNM